MDKHIIFNMEQLKELEQAVLIAEELVSNYYKMSSAQWLCNRYDIKTFKELKNDEIVDGPFAQVLGYEARKNKGDLSSNILNYYVICIQDRAVLEKVEQHNELKLLPFLIYIIVHELVHIVRFSKFEQIYSASSETQCAIDEERKVHSITSLILKKVNVSGMENVLLYHKKWCNDL